MWCQPRTPNPTRLIQRILQIASDKDSLVLDSFAGSGTTGHTVLALNKQDGGNRCFILVEIDEKIASGITAERAKRVAQSASEFTPIPSFAVDPDFEIGTPRSGHLAFVADSAK